MTAAAVSAMWSGVMSDTTTLPEPIVRPERNEKVRRQPPYNVVLINDDDHSYEYVIQMLKQLFGYPEPKGFLLAAEVDTTGRAIVYTTHREKAELKREQVLAYGPDPRMSISKGPLACYIEPAQAD